MQNNIKHDKIKEVMEQMKGVFPRMLKQNGWLVLLLIPVILLSVSCQGEEEPEREPESTSVGGSVLETGYEVDEDKRVVSTRTNFKANEDFYFSFYNNEPFGEEEVKVELIHSDTGEVKAQNTYEVDPEWDLVADMIWFSHPGMYKISVEVGDEVRATREVIIEAEQEQ